MPNSNRTGFCILLTILSTCCTVSSAQKTQSDNGDGTYTNPLIYADFPDPDVIRVDSVYYMVTTTMFIFPGVPILKSYDLVNWQYCSNAVQRMDYSPCYNLDGCNRYSHGQWATSLRYHNGTFYLLFITLNEGGFLCSSKNPEGPWKITHLPRGFYDPGLFFDDDGKIYVAYGNSSIYITELDTNFVAKSSDQLVFTGDIRSGLEGTHMYKINGYYYLYCTYGGGDGFQVALRSTNVYGPYEEKIVIQDNGNLGTGIHQGALVQTQTGEWWSVIFQDGGAFGRFPTLQPVTWVDNWPMVGVNGKGVITYTKPNVGKEYPITVLPTSDEFDSTKLGLQWGWNHNPDSTKWSLTQHPGFLRLHTANVATQLPQARNTLTQRIFAYYSKTLASVADVKMNIDSMLDGDIAGLGVFQDPYAFIGVKKENGNSYIIMVNNGKTIDSTATNASEIYLRASANYGTSQALFEYSLDNQLYNLLGNNLNMQFNLSIFTGNKFCIFNYATQSIGGFVDFDWFRTSACAPSDVSAKLRVNNGPVLDTFRITINAGDSVTLIPQGNGDGVWSWTGCGVSGISDQKTVSPENNCAYTAGFTNACGYRTNLLYYIYINRKNGIKEHESDPGINVFPNPASSELNITSGNFFNKLTILNVDGRILMHKEYAVPVKSVKLSLDLEPGLYILTINDTKKTVAVKLIIK